MIYVYLSSEKPTTHYKTKTSHMLAGEKARKLSKQNEFKNNPPQASGGFLLYNPPDFWPVFRLGNTLVHVQIAISD